MLLSRPTSGMEDVTGLVTDLLASSTSLLAMAAAGLLLRDSGGALTTVGTTPATVGTTPAGRDLQAMLEAVVRGPAQACARQGLAIDLPDLGDAARAWPELAELAHGQGLRSVHCIPVRWSGSVLGVLVLLHDAPGGLEREDRALAQALTDIAAITLVQSRAADEHGKVTSQLLKALETRGVIEQAKGVLSQLAGIGVEVAFAVLRRYARDHNRKLSEVAADVVERRPAAAEVLAHDVKRPGNMRTRP